MGKTELTRTRRASTSDQRDVRTSVMRAAKWTMAKQASARRQLAGHGVDRGDRQRLVRIERRQNTGQPARQHGLSGTGWSREEQVVSAGSGDFERAAADELPTHVG